MATALAYALVLLGVSFVLTAGVLLAGFPIALILIWAPVQVRTRISGTIAGLAGVALAVLFGWGVFRILVGPDSFTVGPLLASIVPLLIPIANDYQHLNRMNAMTEGTTHAVNKVIRENGIPGAQQSGLVGYLLGVTMSVGWWLVAR